MRDLNLDKGLTANKIYSIKRTAEKKSYTVKNKYTSSGAYLEIEISTPAATNVISGLRQMIKDFPDMINEKEIQVLVNWLEISNPLRLLARGNGQFQTLYDHVKMKTKSLKATLSCSLENRKKPRCDVKVTEREVTEIATEELS